MKKIKNIVIVGGGTAGWMSACVLARIIKPMGATITLIETPDIPTIGVGEATIPQIALFNEMVGFDEREFLKATQATYKLGIEFVNWGNIGDSYIHPFGKYGFDMEGVMFHHFWRRLKEEGPTPDIKEYCLQIAAAEAGKFCHPRKDLPNSPLANIQYAFHFDAGLYAKFMREFAIKHGVKRIEDKVIDVTLHPETGHIKSLKSEKGKTIEGDFFLDCSGFRGLLIDKALQSKYEDWSHWLPVNSAVAVGCEAQEDPIPYTRATAHEAGWQWRIPLQNRIGNGYVYCDEYLSAEDAERDMLKRLDGKPLGDPKHLKFKTGMRKNSWVKNCLSLGLAAGFMEPLESTSIHLVQSGLSRLMSMFPDAEFNQTEIDYYNMRTCNEYERIRDFLILHYKATNREDTAFWKYLKNMDIPRKLQEKMDIYEEKGRIFREDNELFNETSWFAVMNGQNLKSKGWHPIVDSLSIDEIRNRLAEIHMTVKNSTDIMPKHKGYIEELLR